MSRRASLPGAAELFRTTTSGLSAVPDEGEGRAATPAASVETGSVAAVSASPAVTGRATEAGVRSVTRTRRDKVGERTPSGRQLHEEKITVYLSPDELFDLEQARLTLRADHGLAVDRGRIVREAVAVVLADLDSKGESSIVVRRLRGR